MFKVVLWDTDQVVEEYQFLRDARRHARRLGHGPYNQFTTSYPPVARVDDEEGVVYNPRFPYLAGDALKEAAQ